MQRRYVLGTTRSFRLINTGTHITVHIVRHRSEDCYRNCDKRDGEDEEEKTVNVSSAKEHVSLRVCLNRIVFQ